MIEISRRSGVSQLVDATTGLIREALDIYSGIPTDELTIKELKSFGNKLIANIDRTSKVIEDLSGVPNIQIIECKVRLQQAVDALFTQLTQIKNDYSERAYSGELTAPDLIDYADFCFGLSLKLVDRISVEQAVINERQANIKLITDED